MRWPCESVDMLILSFSRVILSALLVVLFFGYAEGEVPGTMTYQGRLTDELGNPVPDGPHDVTFRIYNESETVVWEESYSVTTSEGLFQVELGSNGSPLTPDLFDNSECRLGITVADDPELTPRTRLNSVPFAFRTGSVSSREIVDEPGVAAYVGDYYMYLDALTFHAICGREITCPAAGYVLAVAHGRVATLPEHTYGVDSYAMLGISNSATSLPGNQDLDFHIPAAAPSGVYSIPMGLTSMFEVPSAGTYTYYMVGYEESGSISVADMQFNLVYFPTAYGTVDPVPPSVSKSNDDIIKGPDHKLPGE